MDRRSHYKLRLFLVTHPSWSEPIYVKGMTNGVVARFVCQHTGLSDFSLKEIFGYCIPTLHCFKA